MKSTHNSIYCILIALLCVLWCALPAAAADKYVVVIDAGHGGKDHGAIDNGVREKDINLKVALKVGEYIRKNGKNIKVVYTRDKDEYLTLQQRADKANKAKGDLFISIHTNSVDMNNPNRKTVEGASTYTLGLHKNDNNMSVARRENSVMTLENNYTTSYNGFDPNSDESYIIFEMAQKANMANSVKFAEQVQKQLTKQAGRKDRGVHQAGFWVLWATSMPSVLVELDFICNPKSAEFLSSDNGASQLAKGIGSAAVVYFKALEQHNKNRLRTEGSTPRPEDGFANGEEGVVLASTTEEVKKSVAPQPTERTRKPANRRRRSDASRERSERQEYAEAIIQEEQAYIDHSPAATMTSEPVADSKTKATDKAKKQKKDKKTNNKKTNKQAKPSPQQVAQASGKATAAAQKNAAKPQQAVKAKEKKKSAKDQSKQLATATGSRQKAIPAKKTDTSQKADASQGDNGKSPVRLSKVTTVYKIQILTSEERLKAGNPLFHGLSPVTCILEDNTYKYLYGESTNRNEIYHLLSDVQKKIPDAQVIKVKKAL